MTPDVGVIPKQKRHKVTVAFLHSEGTEWCYPKKKKLPSIPRPHHGFRDECVFFIGFYHKEEHLTLMIPYEMYLPPNV